MKPSEKLERWLEERDRRVFGDGLRSPYHRAEAEAILALLAEGPEPEVLIRMLKTFAYEVQDATRNLAYPTATIDSAAKKLADAILGRRDDDT